MDELQAAKSRIRYRFMGLFGIHGVGIQGKGLIVYSSKEIEELYQEDIQKVAGCDVKFDVIPMATACGEER